MVCLRLSGFNFNDQLVSHTVKQSASNFVRLCYIRLLSNIDLLNLTATLKCIGHIFTGTITVFRSPALREATFYASINLDDINQKQHLDSLRWKDSLRGAATTVLSVRLGNYSASHFEGSAQSS